MAWAGMMRAFGAEKVAWWNNGKQIPEGMTDRKARAKNSGIQADDGIVPRCSFCPVAVRCNKAHLAYKLRKCKLLKLSHFQHSSPELSRSPGIVLRGTILAGLAVREQKQIPSGNDRQKSKGNDKYNSRFFGYATLRSG
jgi:hypothetical protein